MTEDQKKDVALFRYTIISDLVNSKALDWGEQERLIREMCPANGQYRFPKIPALDVRVFSTR